MKFNFTHDAIMEMPFETFIMYQNQIQRIADGLKNADDIAEWRKKAETWRRTNQGNG